MEKISERIMAVWNRYGGTAQKIFFLFSVNGSKKFSGLGELAGPWDKQSFLDGWSENPESHGCVGSVSLDIRFVSSADNTIQIVSCYLDICQRLAVSPLQPHQTARN